MLTNIKNMDQATITLLTTQTITFVWLIVSETMPFLNTPQYNGVVHMIVGAISNLFTPAQPTVVTSAPSHLIVVSAPPSS